WVQETILARFVDFIGPEGATHRIPLAGRLSTNHVQTARQFAIAGAGVFAAIDFMVAEDLAAGRLIELLPDWHLASAGVYAVWPANTSRNAISMHFVNFIHAKVTAMRTTAGAAGPSAAGLATTQQGVPPHTQQQ
ncbi:MAG: hypothetical protein KKC85_13265, partial [Gammaproteobacteria bacterium]|nr:hypothetical protein [Gammaproteobacteria bacterium]